MRCPSRRRFIRDSFAVAGLGLVSGCGIPAPPWAATPAVPRVAVVNGRSEVDAAPSSEAFRQGLREHGYEEGRNIAVEWRFLDGRGEQAPEVAREVVSLGVTALVSSSPVFVEAARAATGTVPIILAGVYQDPVGLGVAASLSRPGGNVTGLTFGVPTLQPKHLQLLKETAPSAARLGALWDGSARDTSAPRAKLMEEAGPALGVEVRTYWVSRPDEFEPAFEAMRRDGIGALWVVASTLTNAHAGRIAELALQDGLPTISPLPDFARAGGLMTYAPDQVEMFRRAAGYVHKIIEGAAAAELPIEQPTKFAFVVNLRTAQALGMTIPDSVLAQATELIQ
jgi:putative ABC transport system substrate-binding protein